MQKCKNKCGSNINTFLKSQVLFSPAMFSLPLLDFFFSCFSSKKWQLVYARLRLPYLPRARQFDFSYCRIRTFCRSACFSTCKMRHTAYTHRFATSPLISLLNLKRNLLSLIVSHINLSKSTWKYYSCLPTPSMAQTVTLASIAQLHL